jgi:hypothetical protein
LRRSARLHVFFLFYFSELKDDSPSLMKTTIFTLLLAALPFASAEAALTAYEGFDYTSQFNNRLNGAGTAGDGWAGAWTGTNNNNVLVSPSLSYGALDTEGWRVQFGAAGYSRGLSSTVGSGSTYISFMIESDNTTSGNRWTGLTLLSGGTSGTEVLSIGDIDGGDFGASISVGGLAGDTTTASAAGTSLLTQRFLVARIDFNASGSSENVSLFVDPDLSSEPGTADATLTNIADFSFDAIRIHRGPTSGGNWTNLDEIRIGTTWADVTPVPEPSSSILGILCAIGVCARRRR